MISKTSFTGDLSELKFLLVASENKVKVSKPYSTLKYDFVTDKNGSLKRVQVKAANISINSSGKYKYLHYAVCLKTGYRDEADVIAIHLVDKDEWLIVPIKELAALKGVTRITDRNLKTKYQKYLNSWEILGD